jgi:hypothetical protein
VSCTLNAPEEFVVAVRETSSVQSIGQPGVPAAP